MLEYISFYPKIARSLPISWAGRRLFLCPYAAAERLERAYQLITLSRHEVTGATCVSEIRNYRRTFSFAPVVFAFLPLPVSFDGLLPL